MAKEATTLGELIEDLTGRYRKKEAVRFQGRSISYRELDEQASRVANGLASLGLTAGDRVAIMLPNIPEFVFSLIGIQKLGAIAVPFSTMYKGREIAHILVDSGARAVITLTNFASLIDEIRPDCPALEHLITTGQRTLVFVQPDATAVIQGVFDKGRFDDPEDALRTFGETVVKTLHDLGVERAWYKHRGSIRAGGKKLSTITLSEIENLYVLNAIVFLDALDTDTLFSVIWVPPEIKDRALEPMTSVREETGSSVPLDRFREALVKRLQESLDAELRPGELKRDELLAYQKNRAVASRS